VALEQRKRRVNVGPELLFDLHLEDLKGSDKFVEMEGHPMMSAKKDIQKCAVPLVGALQGDERPCHLRGSGYGFAELIKGRCDVPSLEETIHNSTVAGLSCGLG
jgi:hypothetical protein